VPTDATPTAFSYIRFSTPEQRKGDSLRRQTEAAAEWCKKNKVRLDTSITLHDLGRSAFTGKHRQNPDRHALAAFLKLVEDGKVPRGSFLVIENLDRLSREHIQPALLLVLNLLQAGVRIVQLKPAAMVFDEKSDTLPVMMMIVELSRGHSESAMKADRCGDAWRDKLEAARAGRPQPVKREDRVGGMTILSHRLPAWVEEQGGRPVEVPARAAVVRRIFRLAAAGHGVKLIIRRLTEEKVPPFGAREQYRDEHGNLRYRAPAGERFGSGKWTKAQVYRILTDRRALGEYQPRGRGGKPDGDPIKGYFPAVVTEAEFHAAAAGASQRRCMPGRVGDFVNVFAGLLRDARSGEAYHMLGRSARQGGRRCLINAVAAGGRGRCYSFPFDVFEAEVLARLAEIDPHEILNGDAGPDETQVLAGELARVESSIALIEAEMDEHGESQTLFKRLRTKEAERRKLQERLAAAREEAANPLSEAWGEAHSLLSALGSAPDPREARLRLRAALRRMVDGIHLLVVPRGRDRLCAVQIWFAGAAKHRDYLIYHRPARANNAGRWEGWTRTRDFADVLRPGDLDLRNPEHATDLERVLLAADLAALEAALAGPGAPAGLPRRRKPR
jgi:DNA invertase Pin-like site-specific DNA recombinase